MKLRRKRIRSGGKEDDHVTTLTSTTIDDQIGTSEPGLGSPSAARAAYVGTIIETMKLSGRAE